MEPSIHPVPRPALWDLAAIVLIGAGFGLAFSLALATVTLLIAGTFGAAA